MRSPPGRKHDVRRRRRSGPTTSPSCNTPAAPPASPRARCCCTAIWSPICLQVDAWHAPIVAQPPKVDQLIIVDRAAALSHLRAHRLLPVRRAHRRALPADSQSARLCRALIKELAKYKVNCFPAVNTLYNALLHHPDFGKIDWSMLKMRDRRRHGGAEVGRRRVVQGDRPSDHRRLRPVGDLAGAHLQSRRHHRMDRHHRAAAAVDRDFHPRRRQTTRCRSASAARFARAGRR